MIDSIKEIVEGALYRLDMYSDNALSLIMSTGWAESGYRALRQLNGPAIGFWQVEMATVQDTLDNYVAYRPHINEKLVSLGLDEENLEFSVLSNIALQAAFCRLKYRRDSKPIPQWDDLKGQANYWKRIYNTSLGKGTIEHFIKANELHINKK